MPLLHQRFPCQARFLGRRAHEQRPLHLGPPAVHVSQHVAETKRLFSSCFLYDFVVRHQRAIQGFILTSRNEVGSFNLPGSFLLACEANSAAEGAVCQALPSLTPRQEGLPQACCVAARMFRLELLKQQRRLQVPSNPVALGCPKLATSPLEE